MAWSNYELDAVRRYLEDPDLIARFERRYVNAKLLLRHWWNDRRRHEGPAPSALGAFLASLPDVPQDPAPGAVAATVDDLGRTLALGRPLTDRQRERWERVRDHNRRDCVGTRRLCLMATSDLASAESAAATGTTAVGTHASRIGRDAMRKPTSGLPNDADRPGRSTTTGREHPCPACGSRDVAWILYGLPRWSGELETKLSSGEVALGGCLPWAEAPRFTCHACNAGFRPGDAQETDG